jgi:copper(I)-binding protein
VKQPPLRYALVTLLAVAIAAAHAAGPEVTVAHPRISLLPGDLPLAGYFDLTDAGAQPLRLLGADSPAFARIHMHRSVEDHHMARMLPVGEVEVEPGTTVQFRPGGYHLMLIGRRKELEVGEHVPIRLRFDAGQSVVIEFTVERPGAQ